MRSGRPSYHVPVRYIQYKPTQNQRAMYEVHKNGKVTKLPTNSVTTDEMNEKKKPPCCSEVVEVVDQQPALFHLSFWPSFEPDIFPIDPAYLEEADLLFN